MEENTMNKALGMMLLLVVSLVAAAVPVAAASVPVDVDFVKWDGDEITANEVIDADRNKEYTVKVRFKALADAENLRVEARIAGYEHGIISAVSDIFDIDNGQYYTETLKLRLPVDMDKDNYKLFVEVYDRTNSPREFAYQLDIGSERHAMEIESVVFSPGAEVASGTSLLTTVRLENTGDRDQEARVTISIPDLGVSATDFIDEIEEDEKISSEELFIRIPRCAAPGPYTAEVTVTYNDDYDTVTETRTVYIVDGGLCMTDANKATEEASDAHVTVAAPSNVAAGQKAVFPVSIMNKGEDAASYVLAVTGADWADLVITPSPVITVAGGQTGSAFIYATPKAGVEGRQALDLEIKSGDDTLKKVALSVDVAAAEGDSGLQRALLIALIVVVLILVVLALIVGLNRMKSDDDLDDLDDDEKYY